MFYLVDTFNNYRNTLYYVIYDDINNELSTLQGRTLLSLLKTDNVEIKGIVRFGNTSFRVEKYTKVDGVDIKLLDFYLKIHFDNVKINTYLVVNKPIRISRKITKGYIIAYKHIIAVKNIDGRWDIFYDNKLDKVLGRMDDEQTQNFIDEFLEFIRFFDNKEKFCICLNLKSITNLFLWKIADLTKKMNIDLNITISGFVTYLDFGNICFNNCDIILHNDFTLESRSIGYLDFSKVGKDIETNHSVPDLKQFHNSIVVFCNDSLNRFVKRLMFVNKMIYLGTVDRKNMFENLALLKSKYSLLKGPITDEKFLVIVK